jgi:hypothetical protein
VGRWGRWIGEGLYWWTSSINEAANAGLEAKICVNRAVGSGGLSGPVAYVVMFCWCWWYSKGVFVSAGTEWRCVNVWVGVGGVVVKVGVCG